MLPWRSTFVTNGVLALLGLAGGVLVARVLGVEDRGALAAVIYWPHFIAGIMAMGLNEGVVIRTARARASTTLVATTFALSLALAGAAAITGWLLLPSLLGGERQDYLLFSQMYLVAFLPLTFLAQNLLAIDQGHQRFDRFNAQRIVQAAAYPLLLSAFWAFGFLTVETAAVSVIMGTAIVALFRTWNSRTGLHAAPSRSEAWELLSTSIPLHVANLMMFMSQQADRMILVRFSSDLDLGHYVVALTAASAFGSIVVQTYINIMLPTAARVGSGPDNLEEIIAPLRRLIAIVTLSTAALFLLLPHLVVLVFGREYAVAGLYAQILLLAFAFIGIKKALVYLLRSWGENRVAILAEGFTSILLVVGCYIAVRWWSLTEVCEIVVIAHAAGAAIIGYCFLSRTGLSIRQFIGLAPLASS